MLNTILYTSRDEETLKILNNNREGLGLMTRRTKLYFTKYDKSNLISLIQETKQHYTIDRIKEQIRIALVDINYHDEDTKHYIISNILNQLQLEFWYWSHYDLLAFQTGDESVVPDQELLRHYKDVVNYKGKNTQLEAHNYTYLPNHVHQKLINLKDDALYDALVNELWPPNLQPDLLTIKLLDVRGADYNTLYNWATQEFESGTK